MRENNATDSGKLVRRADSGVETITWIGDQVKLERHRRLSRVLYTSRGLSLNLGLNQGIVNDQRVLSHRVWR